MPKYLIQASYTAEGVQGLLKDGGPVASRQAGTWRRWGQIANPGLVTFRCESGQGRPVFVRAASRKSCPNAQLFVDGGASDARW